MLLLAREKAILTSPAGDFYNIGFFRFPLSGISLKVL
jgi:hypothetical protein